MKKQPSTHRRSRHLRSRARTGAATVETAIALSLFVTLMLGTVDLGYGVFRQHVLTHATRQLARKAIVRGALADRTNIWGPDPVAHTAGDGSEIAEAVASHLVGWKLDEVEIQLQWPDAGNDVRKGQRVQVTMTAPYRPTMTFIFGNPSVTLHSTSTMSIAH